MAVPASVLPLVAVAVAAAVLYLPVVSALAQQWAVDTTTSHGVLLAAAAALVTYRKLPRLRTLPVQPHLGGLAIVAAGLGLYALGTLGAEVFVLRFSLPVVAFGCVVAMWGTAQARTLLAAFGLLLLAIPLPGVVVTSLTMPLQLVASQVAESLLAASSINVAREGNLLVLDRAVLEVAEACSGLRSATSLVSVAAVCAALLEVRPGRGALLMITALPVAIVGNGFRVAATGILTHWIGEAATQGILHDLTGYAAFAVMCAVTVLVLRLTRPARHPMPAPAGV